MTKRKSIGTTAGMLAIALVLGGCSLFTPTDTPPQEEKSSQITLDKSEYTPEEEIVVNYNLVEELGNMAWIGIIPAGTGNTEEESDAVDTMYEYIDTNLGEVSLYAPNIAGDYEVRAFTDDSIDGVQVAKAPFTVVEAEEGNEDMPTGTLTLDNETYAPGDTVTVSFEVENLTDVTAWVGLIPSDVEHGSEATNDANDTAYKYLGGDMTGEFEFTAPSEPGTYDIRLNSSDSGTDAFEVAYVTFTVE